MSNVSLDQKNDIDLTKSYNVCVRISSDTPLPLDKFIGFTIGYSDREVMTDPEISIQAIIGAGSVAILVDTLSTGTQIIGFKFTPRIEEAVAIDNTTQEKTPISTLKVDSLTVSIVTDGIKLSLDKAKSTIKVLGT